MKKRIMVYGVLGVLLICTAAMFSCTQNEPSVMPPPPAIEQIAPEVVAPVIVVEPAVEGVVLPTAEIVAETDGQTMNALPLPTTEPAVETVIAPEPVQPAVK
jgi:hypothetical protein